jgi:HSP20 family molecular chaperone IbpA
MASEDKVWIRVAAPGITIDDIRIRVRGRSVSVVSRRLVRRPPRGAEFIQAEIPLGAFERRIDLPWEAHPKALRMRLINGIVELMLARMGVDLGQLVLDEEDDDGR